MKLSRTAFGLVLAAASRSTGAGLASAFTTVTRGGPTTAFLGRRSVLPSRIIGSYVPLSPSKSTTGLGMNIFTRNISQEQRNAYENLSFPANEIGDAAMQGKALVTSPSRPDLSLATFAGGCFWGLELAYQRVPGVEFSVVGYTQGNVKYPT